MFVARFKRVKLQTQVFFFGLLLATGMAEVGPDWIEQWGIRWTFDKPLSVNGEAGSYRYGQFVNGDYWVIGPVNIVAFDPPSHLTEPGEKDENGVAYYSASLTKGSGAWTIFSQGGYNRATILTSDTSGISVGSWLTLTGATGSGASKVNGYSFYVDSKVDNTSFTINEGTARRFNVGDVISGGTFGGAIINGSMINPPLTPGVHAYTTGDSAGWTPSLNVAWGVDRENPLVVPANSSLISTGSRKDTGSNNRSSVQRASILTVLPSNAFDQLPENIVPSDCFRPAYIGSIKPIRHWKQQLNYDFLQQLPPVAESWPGIPSLAAMEEQFKRPWINKPLGYTRYIRPANNMPDYWVQMATNDGALVLNLNHTNQQKEMLLIYYTQLGIDLYGPYEAGSQGNGPDGGIYSGILLPILVAGKALNYNPMMDICHKSGNYVNSAKPGGGKYSPADVPPDYLYFSELDQTYYVTQLEIDITNGNHPIPWQPSGYALSNSAWIQNGGPYSYGDAFVSRDIGLPEYGLRHVPNPGYSCKMWDVYKDYRSLNSPNHTQAAFLLLAMGLREKVNHEAFFDYADRCAAIYGSSVMRATYRANFGPIWPNTDTAPTTYTLSITAANGSVTKRVNGTVTTATNFAQGTVVELTAAANTGYTFGSWSGSISGTTNPVTVTMDANMSITANFTQNTHTLSITAANGSVTKRVNGTVTTATSFVRNTVVELTATANTGYTFGSWSGSATGTINPVTVTMNGDKSVTANFTQLIQQAANDNFANALTLTGLNGNTTANNTGATKESGEPSHAGYAGGCSLWWWWTAPDSGQVTIDTFGSTFDTLLAAYTGSSVSALTVVASNDDSGGVEQSQITFNAAAGTTYRIAVDGWNFRNGNIILNWNLAPTSPTTYILTTTAANGSVTKRVNGTVTTATNFAQGTVVELTAAASIGYTFGNWSGSASGTTNPVTVTMDANKTVTANFSQNTYTLIINAANGSVTKRVNGTLTTATSFAHGTVVSLTAAPNTGYTFANWSGSASGTTNPVTVTMDANKTVTANFTQNTYTLSINPDKGSVTKRVNGTLTTATSFTHGTVVELTATASTGYTFGNWSGSASGTANPVTVTMDADKTINANFTANEVITEPDLVAHWQLASVNDNMTLDLSGNKHHASLAVTNNPSIQFGSGMLFNGVNSYLEVPDADALELSRPMTFSTWIKLNAMSSFSKIIVKPHSSYATPWEMYTLDLGSSGNTPRFIVTDGLVNGVGAAAFNSNTRLNTGEWYHLAGTYDGNAIALYVNGNLIATQTAAFAIGTNNMPLCLGGRMGQNTLNGYMNDVRIYNASLTAEQVLRLYQKGQNDELKAHWLFNPPHQSTVLDITGEQAASLINEPEWSERWQFDNPYVVLPDGRQAVQIPMGQCRSEAGTIAIRVQSENSDAMQILFGHAISNINSRIALYLAAGNLAVNIGNTLNDGIMALTPGQSYHIALTWNGTDYAVFIDGVQKASGTFSGLTQLGAFADVGNYGTVENRENGLGFRGLVEDVQLYARALNTDEIESLALTHFVSENRPLGFVVSGQDNMGNLIRYTAGNLPEGASFDSATQTFSWRPEYYNSAGRYNIRFSAAGQLDQTITVSVQDVPLSGWYKDFLVRAGIE